MDRREIQVIPFKFPGVENVLCLFTTRRGGKKGGLFNGANLSFGLGDDEDVIRSNRGNLLDFLNVSHLAEVRQIHGDRMVFIDEHWRKGSLPEEADALATHLSGIPLLIKVADCQPVLLTHIKGRVIAALHVGWRANRGRFIPKWIEEFCSYYRCHPREIMAIRGPSLGPCHSEFINFSREWGRSFVRYYRSTTRTVDLWQMTRDQLIEAGLPEKNIFSMDICTYCCGSHFFSYRRERVTGRQGGVIIKS